MGRKGSEMRKNIKNELYDSQKTGQELKESLKIKLKHKPKHFDKSFTHALIKLIEDKEVIIVGYDSNADDRQSKQTFKVEPCVFDSTERLTRLDVSKKFRDAEENNQEVKELFKLKHEKLKEIYAERWKFLETNTFYLTSHKIMEEMLNLPYYEEIKNFLENLEIETQKTLLNKWLNSENRTPESEVNILYNIMDLQDREDNRLDLIVGREIEKALFFFSLAKHLEYFKNAQIWICPIPVSEFYDIHQKLGRPFITDFETLIECMDMKPYPTIKVDTNGLWEKNEALKQCGFIHPMDMEKPEIAFEHINDIILTYPQEDQEILKSILVKGLSDETDSILVFSDFYSALMALNYKIRIKSILGKLKGNSED